MDSTLVFFGSHGYRETLEVKWTPLSSRPAVHVGWQFSVGRRVSICLSVRGDLGSGLENYYEPIWR